MQRTVDASLEDVDAFLFVLAADERIGAGDRFIAERVFGGGAPVVIALNKVDRVEARRGSPRRSQAAAALGDFHALHPVSALTGDGRRTRCATSSSRCCRKGRAYFPRRTSAPTCRSRRGSPSSSASRRSR